MEKTCRNFPAPSKLALVDQTVEGRLKVDLRELADLVPADDQTLPLQFVEARADCGPRIDKP